MAGTAAHPSNKPMTPLRIRCALPGPTGTWTSVYYAQFIPLADAVRLLGRVYNDALKPDNPYEFLSLLGGEKLAALERNELLSRMADLLRSKPDLAARLERGEADVPKNEVASRQAVEEALAGFYMALNAMLGGDPVPLENVYSHHADVLYMPAQGGVRVGWEQVFADWKDQARLSAGGRAEYEIAGIVMGEDMAVCTSITQAESHSPNGKSQRASLRETSVFRLERGGWKMVAHHADILSGWADTFAEEEGKG